MDSLEKVKKRALRILGNRNYSEQEMYTRLTGKGESPEDAEETVKWLVELGYINDDDYAKLVVAHYSAKGYGATRIRDELFKRGIPRDIWDEVTAGIEGAAMEDSAVEFLRKKLRGGTDKDDLRRASNTLVRRGFSFDEAKTAVNRYLECPEE